MHLFSPPYKYVLILLVIACIILLLHTKDRIKEHLAIDTYDNKKIISFCSTCMCRFDQLKDAFFKNVANHVKYADKIEFVLVNFIKDEEGEEIDVRAGRDCRGRGAGFGAEP